MFYVLKKLTLTQLFMKKNLKNIVKILIVSVLLTSCASENLDKSNQDPSMVKAKKWFDTNKPNLEVLNFTNSIDWNNAIVTSGIVGTVVEVPLILKENTNTNIGDDESYKTNIRLMFIEDEKETYKIYAVILTTNDIMFDNKNKKFNVYNVENNYKGYVTLQNSKNVILNSKNYDKGQKISTPKNSNTSAKWVCKYVIQVGTSRYCKYTWEDDPYNSTDPYTPEPSDSYNYSYFPSGSDGGSGSGSTSTGTVAIVVVGPSNKITIKDYLKCFNLTLNAQFTIYVKQPTANSGVSWSGSSTDPDVGHTFIAIQQGNTRRVFGYYPDGTVDPYLSPSDPPAFGNDQGHLFDVALSIPINPSQLQNIISTSENAISTTYNLNTNNCTDFAIQTGNLAGLNLPDAFGTWPGGGGSNPGQLGQVIRGMILPPNAYRQTTSTTAGLNNGVCN